MRLQTFIATAASLAFTAATFGQTKLLNVSYDPTRELYEEINQSFVDAYAKAHNGTHLTIEQSHGGSGKQARAVVDGLGADVVTFALSADVDTVQKAGLINSGWQSRLPANSSPYTSTIVFLVRHGNPKAIKDWDDLIKPGVKVITANPKTGGGARWNFLAAWGYAAQSPTHDAADLTNAKASSADPDVNNAAAREYITKLFKNVPVLDTGARGSTLTFTQKGVGDVLLAWENEAYLAQDESPGKYDIVYPSVSILAEPPVAVVDKNVDAHGTREPAEAYLKYLYTPDAQEIIAENHYRPRDPSVLAKHESELPKIKLFTIDEGFGGWAKAQPAFFGDGGVFDQIYKK